MFLILYEFQGHIGTWHTRGVEVDSGLLWVYVNYILGNGHRRVTSIKDRRGNVIDFSHQFIP